MDDLGVPLFLETPILISIQNNDNNYNNDDHDDENKDDGSAKTLFASGFREG